MRTYRFCPLCSAPLALESAHDQTIPVCQRPDCRFHFWQNAKPAATLMISDAQGRILMGVRAVDPDKGKLDLPGGFLNENEHPEAAAKREAKEELGVDVELGEVIGFATDPYGTEGDIALVIAFVARIIGGTLRASDDVAALEWIDPATVDRSRLAFTNNAYFLSRWSERIAAAK